MHLMSYGACIKWNSMQQQQILFVKSAHLTSIHDLIPLQSVFLNPQKISKLVCFSLFILRTILIIMVKNTWPLELKRPGFQS